MAARKPKAEQKPVSDELTNNPASVAAAVALLGDRPAPELLVEAARRVGVDVRGAA